MTEPRFTHVDETGAARMVDVSAKDVSVRSATATGSVLVSSEVVALLRGGGGGEGDREQARATKVKAHRHGPIAARGDG